MTIDRITRKQADALATLMHTLRPDWDKAGCWAAVAAAKELAPGRDLAVAAIRCTGIATNRTPGVLALEGPHWRGSDHTPRIPELKPDERCSVCSKRKGTCGTDHQFISAVTAARNQTEPNKWVEQIRAELSERNSA
jgi:hypothetical protein